MVGSLVGSTVGRQLGNREGQRDEETVGEEIRYLGEEIRLGILVGITVRDFAGDFVEEQGKKISVSNTSVSRQIFMTKSIL